MGFYQTVVWVYLIGCDQLNIVLPYFEAKQPSGVRISRSDPGYITPSAVIRLRVVSVKALEVACFACYPTFGTVTTLACVAPVTLGDRCGTKLAPNLGSGDLKPDRQPTFSTSRGAKFCTRQCGEGVLGIARLFWTDPEYTMQSRCCS